MNDADRYVIDTLKSGKRYSGKKVTSLGGLSMSITEIYVAVHDIKQPICPICENEIEVTKLSTGFPKYCSQECYNTVLSENNQHKNKKMNKERSEILLQSRIDTLKDIEKEYVSDKSTTIESLSGKYNIPVYAIRKYLLSNGTIDNNRQSIQRSDSLSESFDDVNTRLSNEDWNHLTAKEISSILEVSPNYVATYLRSIGKPLTRNTMSSHERLLLSVLPDNVIQNDRTIISPLELDFVIPDKKIAIEVNGIYWHSKHDKNYHMNKTEKSNDKGYSLIHVYDFEIDNDLPKIESIINSHIGKNEKVYARKTKVDSVDNSSYKQFCNDNHIQGHINASIKLGLFSENELVAIMSFGKSRYNKKYEYELLRYCSKLNTNVVGGASKLFEHFKRNYNPESVISYAQRRIFNGNMYRNLGMTFSHYSPPGYFWANQKGDIMKRYKTQSHILGGPEKEVMENKHYHKVYDCGQSVFTWGAS